MVRSLPQTLVSNGRKVTLKKDTGNIHIYKRKNSNEELVSKLNSRFNILSFNGPKNTSNHPRKKSRETAITNHSLFNLMVKILLCVRNRIYFWQRGVVCFLWDFYSFLKVQESLKSLYQKVLFIIGYYFTCCRNCYFGFSSLN